MAEAVKERIRRISIPQDQVIVRRNKSLSNTIDLDWFELDRIKNMGRSPNRHRSPDRPSSPFSDEEVEYELTLDLRTDIYNTQKTILRATSPKVSISPTQKTRCKYLKETHEQILKDLVREVINATFSFGPTEPFELNLNQTCEHLLAVFHCCEATGEKQTASEFYTRLENTFTASFVEIMDVSPKMSGTLFQEMVNAMDRSTVGHLAYDELKLHFFDTILAPAGIKRPSKHKNRGPSHQRLLHELGLCIKPERMDLSDILVHVTPEKVGVRVPAYYKIVDTNDDDFGGLDIKNFEHIKVVVDTELSVIKKKVLSRTRSAIFPQSEGF